MTLNCCNLNFVGISCDSRFREVTTAKRMKRPILSATALKPTEYTLCVLSWFSVHFFAYTHCCHVLTVALAGLSYSIWRKLTTQSGKIWKKRFPYPLTMTLMSVAAFNSNCVLRFYLSHVLFYRLSRFMLVVYCELCCSEQRCQITQRW